MKITTIAKISPLIEMTSPILNQCRMGECGNCPKGTGKLLWVTANHSGIFNLQYNFFDISTEGTGSVRVNYISSSTTINGALASYHNPPTRAYAIATPSYESPTFSPSLMKGTNKITSTIFNNGWLYFRQTNPAVGNVLDALCFEYNHEKSLITFRSF